MLLGGAEGARRNPPYNSIGQRARARDFLWADLLQLSLYAGRTIEDMKLHWGASRLMPRSFRWGWARRPLDPASNQLLEHSRQFLGCCYKYNLYYVLALQETPLQMLVVFSGHILLIL